MDTSCMHEKQVSRPGLPESVTIRAHHPYQIRAGWNRMSDHGESVRSIPSREQDGRHAPLRGARDPKREQDRRLVERCLKESRDAWDEMYCRFIGLVRVLVRRRRVAQQDAEDLVQETFARLAHALRNRQYDATAARLSTYIAAITHNVCSAYFKSLTKAESLGDCDNHAGLGPEHESSPERPDQIAERAERMSLLRWALRKLPEECQEILWLLCCKRLPYKTISEILGAKEAALRKRTSRCRVNLKQMLQQKGIVP